MENKPLTMRDPMRLEMENLDLKRRLDQTINWAILVASFCLGVGLFLGVVLR